MAGGFGGTGLPLGARNRARTAPAPPVAPGVERAAELTPCPVRHCFVSAPVDGGTGRPGLLLEWRKVEGGGWEGRVVYAAELRPGQWATVEEWVAAGLLRTAAG
jgi:hypothetical protein